MSKVKVKLPDNSVREFQSGVTAYEVTQSIGEGLAKAALAAEINGTTVDLTTTIEDDVDFKVFTGKDDTGVDVLRHSAAHLMAQAVSHLFPGTKYAIGPSIKDGFYYDFDTEHRFTPDDLEKIEKEMERLAKENQRIERKIISKKDAVQYFKERKDPYKVEILEEQVKDDTVSIYSQGDFSDLCRGPHVPNTGYIKAFKLLSIAGAYWRGDEKNKMLQRIYGTAFPGEKELKAYLNKLEEAKKRDHRKIGKEMDLFSFHEEGPGFPFWHPKGTVIYNTLADYIRKENTLRGYVEIRTPTLLTEDLWHKSGHWDNFHENMYFTQIDERDFAVKPMNCPGGLLVYKSNVYSYRHLPHKVAELGTVHRHELSGVLHGLFRVRCFTQDDAHIFCTEEQLEEQIMDTTKYVLDVYKTFGFQDFQIYIATRPEKSIGSPEVWEFATDVLKKSLEAMELPYKIKAGEGAFYGPKIEFNIKDCLDRHWQCGTIQVDFSMPNRFELHYEGSDGQRHVPVMVHRAIFGSLERFIGILIEHYEGKFPLWIAPVQIKILPVSDKYTEYAKSIHTRLIHSGIRSETDLRNDSLGYKIRAAQMDKVPYMLILGENEMNSDTVSVRDLKGKQKQGISLPDFLEMVNREIQDKTSLENSYIFSTNIESHDE